MRPDWTKYTYDSDGKLDLSTNICHDISIPKYNFRFNSYNNAGKCYSILSDYHNVEPENIAIGLGLSELINRILQVVKNRNYKIDIWAKPTWKPVEVMQNVYGIESGKDVLYISNPNGNTGHYRKDIDVIVKDYKLAIVDEAYSDFTRYQKVSLADNVLVLKTLSKSIAMPGLRFAWAIGAKNIIKEIQDLRPAHVITTNVQDYLFDILNNIPAHVNRMNETKEYIETKFDCEESQGNFVLFKELPANLENTIKVKKIGSTYRMALCNLETFKNAIAN
jgi:histidinol-phosphate/aromatic aminotransferase/cobyric acid decarboxylase-like protein